MNDLAEALRIYAAAREYMSAHGNPTQWGSTYPPVETVASDIENGNLYFCEVDGKAHGVFAFIEGADKTYAVIENGAWPDDEPYNVMHRMASDGAVRGIGKAALDFCKANSGNVRADTHKDNIPMQKALVKRGFKYCGIIYLENGDERLAYQKI